MSEDVNDTYGLCRMYPQRCECLKQQTLPSRMCKNWVSVSELTGVKIETTQDLRDNMKLIRERTDAWLTSSQK